MPDAISDVFSFYCLHRGILGPLLRGDRQVLPLTTEQQRAFDAAAPHIDETMVDVLVRCWTGFRGYDYRHRRHAERAQDQTLRRVVRQTRSVWGPIITEGEIVAAKAGYSFSEVDSELHLTAWVWVHPAQMDAAASAVPWARATAPYLWLDEGVLRAGRSIDDIVNHLVPNLVNLVRSVESAWRRPVQLPDGQPS